MPSLKTTSKSSKVSGVMAKFERMIETNNSDNGSGMFIANIAKRSSSRNGTESLKKGEQKYFSPPNKPQRTMSNITDSTVSSTEEESLSQRSPTSCVGNTERHNVQLSRVFDDGNESVDYGYDCQDEIDYGYGDEDCRPAQASAKSKSFDTYTSSDGTPIDPMRPRSLSNDGLPRRARRTSLVGSTPYIANDIVIDGEVIEAGSLNQASTRVKDLPREQYVDDSDSDDDDEDENASVDYGYDDECPGRVQDCRKSSFVKTKSFDTYLGPRSLSNDGLPRRTRRTSLVGSTPYIANDIVIDGEVIEAGSLNQASTRVKDLPREQYVDDSDSDDDDDE